MMLMSLMIIICMNVKCLHNITVKGIIKYEVIHVVEKIYTTTLFILICEIINLNKIINNQ